VGGAGVCGRGGLEVGQIAGITQSHNHTIERNDPPCNNDMPSLTASTMSTSVVLAVVAIVEIASTRERRDRQHHKALPLMV
jgi:hypothetical protein